MLSDFAETGDNAKLTVSVAEKKQLEPRANMVAIIETVERLERGFGNGVFNEKEYEQKCSALIAQFKVFN